MRSTSSDHPFARVPSPTSTFSDPRRFPHPRLPSTASRSSISTTARRRRSLAQVIDAITRYYEPQNANIHRGVYELSQAATDAYEAGPREGRGVSSTPATSDEIIFTRGTTESINLVAATWGRDFLTARR